METIISAHLSTRFGEELLFKPGQCLLMLKLFKIIQESNEAFEFKI